VDQEPSNEYHAALEELPVIAAVPLVMPIGLTQPYERVAWHYGYKNQRGRPAGIVDQTFRRQFTKQLRLRALAEEFYDNTPTPEEALIALEDAREAGELPDEEETVDPDSVAPETDEPFDDLGLN
jgi:hypothetical protein